jgi:HPt (histidine-containing phosphotransfer) domain-containing protein
MDDYISKPFSQKALADTLGRWVALPRPAGAIPPAARSADQETPPAAINPLALDAILALGTGQGESLLRRVLAAFLQDTPRQLTMLHEAIAKRDANAIRKAAHSLKSSSANVGADALAKLFKDMEQMGRSGNTGNAAGLLAQLEREFQSVRQSLSLIMAKGA